MAQAPQMSRARSVAQAVFVAAVLVNLWLTQTAPADRFFMLRGLPVWALCVRLVATVPARRSRWILAALLLGSIGDVVLALAARVHPVALFLAGMGAFLVGHVCYVAAFAPNVWFRAGRMVPAALVLLLGLSASVTLLQVLGTQGVPMVVYACALCGMVITAVLQRSPRLLVPTGAGLFLLSDALLAVHRFLHPLPLAGLWILLTYWGAQLLLSEGWATDELTERRDAHAVHAHA